MFTQKLKEVLARKSKGQPIEEQNLILGKLEKHERLTDDEFWSLYSSIRKNGPEVRYPNPQDYTNYEFTRGS